MNLGSLILVGGVTVGIIVLSTLTKKKKFPEIDYPYEPTELDVPEKIITEPAYIEEEDYDIYIPEEYQVPEIEAPEVEVPEVEYPQIPAYIGIPHQTPLSISEINPIGHLELM